MRRRDVLALVALSACGIGLRRPRQAAQGGLLFGYAAITWGGRDREAIEQIAEVGFRGVQLRTAAYDAFRANPGELKDLLASHRLAMVALSSGTVSVDGDAGAQIAEHTRHAEFVKAVGGKYLQIIDNRPIGRPLVPGDYQKLGRLLTELGRRTADLGIPLGYHNHMNSLGEAPDEVARVLDAIDPRVVKFELDVAHYQQGGGDPVKAIRDYRSQLLFLHLKDVEPRAPQPGQTPPRPYRFVELGRGRVDLPGVMRALRTVGFSGWVVVELDAVPDNARTPKASAEINKRYLVETLRQTL